MFLNKIRNIFCVPDTKFVSAQMLRAGANGETFVSSTMCLQQCVLFCQGLSLLIMLQDFFLSTNRGHVNGAMCGNSTLNLNTICAISEQRIVS